MMKPYLGVKLIYAEPQACQKDVHNSKVGDPGYKVQYEDGYISWSPAKVFEDAYFEINDEDPKKLLQVAIETISMLGE